jgi:hypothetical protein
VEAGADAFHGEQLAVGRGDAQRVERDGASVDGQPGGGTPIRRDPQGAGDVVRAARGQQGDARQARKVEVGEGVTVPSPPASTTRRPSAPATTAASSSRLPVRCGCTRAPAASSAAVARSTSAASIPLARPVGHQEDVAPLDGDDARAPCDDAGRGGSSAATEAGGAGGPGGHGGHHGS